MLALPETAMPDTPVRFMKPVTLPALEVPPMHPLKQALCACAGAGLVFASLGVWLVPVTPGDTEMQLIKLLFSVVMLFVGLLCIKALRKEDTSPEIELDTNRRLLRVIGFDEAGARREQAVYKLEELSELTLRDRFLTARDQFGKEVVSIPVRNKLTEKTICAALSAML